VHEQDQRTLALLGDVEPRTARVDQPMLEFSDEGFIGLPRT
jgi:hypothetical protein